MPTTTPIDTAAVQRMERMVALLERGVMLSRQIRDNLGGIGGGTASGAASGGSAGITLPNGMMLPSGVGSVSAGAFAARMAAPSPMGVPMTTMMMPMGAAGGMGGNAPAPFGGFAPGSPGGAGLIPYLQSNANVHAAGQFAHFGAQQISQGLQLQTQAIMTGRPDPLGNARLGGSIIGGIIGGIGGALTGNPLAIGAGIGAGAMIGGSLVENMFAPGLKAEQKIGDTLPMANLAAGLNGRYGGSRLYIDPGGRIGLQGSKPGAFGDRLLLDGITVPNGLAGPTMDLISSARGLHSRILKMAGKANLAPTEEEILKSGTRFSEALIGGGRNPFETVGNEPDYIAPENEEYGRKFYKLARDNDRRKDGFSITRNLLTVSALAISASLLAPTRHKGKPETLLGRYQRRAYERHLTGGDDVLKDIEGIVSSEPETGGNTADILSRFGATKTYRYNQLQGEKDAPDPISLETLMRSSAELRSNDRTRSMAGLQARGSGAATASALTGRMGTLAALPGGKDSLEHAQAQASWRGADSRAFDEKNITEFGIPRERLQGNLDRLNSLPFSPGNRIGMEAKMIGLDRRELSSVVAFRQRRSAAGQLSEEEEFGLVQREEALKTDVFARVGSLSQGMENKLPAMTAGRPLNYRGNSFTLAAIRASGTPIRLYGSVNGSDAASKDEFVNQLTGGMDSFPYPGKSGMNPGGGNTGRIEELLQTLIQTVQSNGGRMVSQQQPQANRNEPRQNRVYDNGAN